MWGRTEFWSASICKIEARLNDRKTDMPLRVVISACCATFVLLGPAQAFGVECATEAQRKIEIEKLNESVDWFLSTVEEAG